MPSLDLTPAADRTDPVRAVLDALRAHPDAFSETGLAELAAMGHELSWLAAHQFCQRLLTRDRQAGAS